MSNTLRKFQYILEGIDQEHLTDILVKRLKSRYPDISTKYEEDVLHDAAMDVASFHAGAEELGTSDIGAMIKEVIKNLERFNERGQGEKMIPNSVRGWRMNEETEPERVVRQLKAAKKYLGQDPEPKEPEEKETNESYWGGPSPAQLRFNRALKKQQNSPENKADRKKFQKELDRIMPPPKKEPEDKEVTEGAAISTSGKTDSGYTWKFEAGREVPFKTDIDVNTFIRVTDPDGKTVAGVWADVDSDSLVVEYSQVFDEELRGKGLYTDLLKSLSKQYDVTSDTDTNNAAVGIYRRLGADYDAGQARHTLRKQGVAEGSNNELPNHLVSEFLKSISPKELRYYIIRDNCGPAALHMKDWAEGKGIDLTRHQGYFVADNVVYDKADFTKEMKREFIKQGLDFNDPTARKQFIESNPKYSEEWKKIPHYWLQDKQGNIYDPTGYIQFVKTGLSSDLAKSRYTLIRQGVAEGKLNFEEGDCPIFAIALHRLSKMPLMALVEYDEQMGSTVLIHAYVKLDDRWRLDASGETDIDWMLQKYPNNGNAEEIEISEKDLLELGYGKSKCPTLQQVLPHAKEVLQNIEEGQQGVAEGRKKKNKKTSRSLGRYFFPGYGYYGSGESGEGGGDGDGGESMAEGTNVDIGGIQLNVVADGAEVIIRPSVDGYQAGYVVFDRDGSTLVPADLAIDEEFRGQGIAKIIYDYVKSLGFTIRRSSDQTKAGKHFWDKNRGEDSQVWEQTMTLEELDEACWKGYHKEGMKTMFGKRYPNCVKNTNEDHQQCPECGGPMFSEEMINEKKDACYYKVKSRYKVWPSAYASGALVKCRKKGASNWGNSTKNESSILEGLEQTDENLHKWFKEKWVRFGPDGKIRGDCARGDDSEGKPKCLPQSKAQNLGKKGRASAAARKRREDPNPERSGKAINVATKKKTSESSILQGISETKGLPMPSSYEQENKPFLRKGGQKLMALTTEQEELEEKWSDKYKRSIDCNNPKGFSQRAHCQGRKKK